MVDKIKDYISGQEINAGPEEIEAVQIFSRQLVEDYGYPKANIQTRPQFCVKARPSDTRKEYPVDISVFSSEKHTDDNIQIIVECKKKNRKDGKTQLQDYLTPTDQKNVKTLANVLPDGFIDSQVKNFIDRFYNN